MKARIERAKLGSIATFVAVRIRNRMVEVLREAQFQMEEEKEQKFANLRLRQLQTNGQERVILGVAIAILVDISAVIVVFLSISFSSSPSSSSPTRFVVNLAQNEATCLERSEINIHNSLLMPCKSAHLVRRLLMRVLVRLSYALTPLSRKLRNQSRTQIPINLLLNIERIANELSFPGLLFQLLKSFNWPPSSPTTKLVVGRVKLSNELYINISRSSSCYYLRK